MATSEQHPEYGRQTDQVIFSRVAHSKYWATPGQTSGLCHSRERKHRRISTTPTTLQVLWTHYSFYCSVAEEEVFRHLIGLGKVSGSRAQPKTSPMLDLGLLGSAAEGRHRVGTRCVCLQRRRIGGKCPKALVLFC